jgi:hypothetical protein
VEKKKSRREVARTVAETAVTEFEKDPSKPCSDEAMRAFESSPLVASLMFYENSGLGIYPFDKNFLR